MGYGRLGVKFVSYIWALGLFFVSAQITAQGVSTAVGGISNTPTKVSAGSIFWNPASIGFVDNTSIETNIALMGGWLIYDREGTDPTTGDPFDSSSTQILAPNPFLSVSSPLGTQNFRFAYSTYFPSGAIADFDNEGAQRYDLISGMFLPWNHQLTVAYSPNSKWSFAAAFVYSAAFLEASLNVDMGKVFESSAGLKQEIKEHPSLSSPVQLERSTASSLGGSFGVLYRPSIQWSFGTSFTLPMSYKFEQNMALARSSFFEVVDVAATSLGLEAQTDVGTHVNIEMPAILAAGFRYQPFGYWTGEYYGRYVFSSFTRFASVRFADSPLVTLAGEERVGPKAKDNYFLGTTQSFSIWRSFLFGLSTGYHWNGVDDELLSTSRVDFDSLNVGVFSRYRWTKDFRVGLEYNHTFMFERRITNSIADEPTDLSIVRTPSGNGTYRAGVDRLALNVAYDF
jgi:long-subunit fatty acid transport protein